jgi:hypothetical protein
VNIVYLFCKILFGFIKRTCSWNHFYFYFFQLVFPTCKFATRYYFEDPHVILLNNSRKQIKILIVRACMTNCKNINHNYTSYKNPGFWLANNRCIFRVFSHLGLISFIFTAAGYFHEHLTLFPSVLWYLRKRISLVYPRVSQAAKFNQNISSLPLLHLFSQCSKYYSV